MQNDKKKANEIMSKFQKARAKRQLKDDLWKELDAFDRNDQWSLQNAPAWLPKPVTNFVHLVKYTKRAAFAVENPTGKLRPVSPIGVEPIKKLNKAYEDTADRIKLRKVVRENIETAKLLGTSFAYVYWDENAEGRMGTTIQGDEGFQYEGEIKVREVLPSSFYPDPNAFELEDCEFFFIVERKPREWVRKNPKFQTSDMKKDDFTGASNPQERGEIFQRDYTTSQMDGLVDLYYFFEKKMNDEGGFTYSITYLAEGKILHTEKLRPNRYPLVPLRDFKQRQDFWGMSTCQIILDNQKIVNKVESIIAMIGLLLQNPQKVVTEASKIDPVKLSKFGSAPAQVWVTSDLDPSRAIHHVQPPTIPPVLFNLLEQAKQNIREITGLNEAYMGQNVGSLQTSSGVQALIDRSTMRDRDQMYDVELFIEEVTKLIIDFMTTYYEEERLIRILGENGEVTFESFKGTDFKDLAYDVAVDVSARAPITRMREMQEAKELLNLQGQYGANYAVPVIKPQEAIEMMNMVHGQRIIERMNTEEMQNKVEQAMQVAQMGAEAMGQGVPPEEVTAMMNAMFEQMENPSAPSSGGSPEAPNSFNPTNIPQGV